MLSTVRPNESRGPRSRRTSAFGVVVTFIVALAAAATAGYVIDGAGQPAFGFWAAIWGSGVGLLGLSIVATVNRWPIARLVNGLLAVAAAVVGGMVLLYTGPFRMSLTSLEGLWMDPLVLALFAVAVVAGRRALSR